MRHRGWRLGIIVTWPGCLDSRALNRHTGHGLDRGDDSNSGVGERCTIKCDSSTNARAGLDCKAKFAGKRASTRLRPGSGMFTLLCLCISNMPLEAYGGESHQIWRDVRRLFASLSVPVLRYATTSNSDYIRWSHVHAILGRRLEYCLVSKEF